jgi:sugar lactone lactonase YvrE
MGNIFVVDISASKIARYDPLGRFTGHFGSRAPGLNGEDPTTRFTEPRAATCTYDGKLIVTEGDTQSGRIVVLDSSTGSVETSVTHPGRQLGKLSRPSGVALSPRLRTGFSDGYPRTDAYVADSMNNRILRFECK